MKNSMLGASLSKVVSLLLALAIMVSMAGVFIGNKATVSADDEVVEENPVSVIYNRTFDEGWPLDNGLAASGGNGQTIDKEQTVDYTNNYFWRVTLFQVDASYNELSFDGHDKIGSVVEFDMKVDDYCNFGRIMYLRTKGGSVAGTAFNLMYVIDNKLTFFASNSGAIMLTEEWVHIALVFDYSQPGDQDVAVSAYVDNQLVAESTITIKKNQSKGIDFIRIGNPGSNKDVDFGDSYCIDNMQVYSGTNQLVEITPEMGAGTGVDENAAKTITIEGKADPTLTALNESLAMKLGVEYCYSDGERLPILTDANGKAYGAPLKVDGKVMLSLERALEHMGYPMYAHEDGSSVDISTGESVTNVLIGSTYAMVAGKRVELSVAPGFATGVGGNKFLVIAAEDLEKIVPGWYVTYDEMGLLIVSPIKNIINRDQHLTNMTGIMKKFVFDYPSPEQIYEDVKAQTNNFDHPYILTNQQEIDHLREIYLTPEGQPGYNKQIKDTIQYLIDYAERVYRIYAMPMDNGSYDEYVGFDIREIPYQPYQDSFGYDPVGGRLVELETYCGYLHNLATAYQFSRNPKYAQCAYDLAMALGDWEHWGPGVVLNLADSSGDFAVYFDWTYDINVELGLDVDRLAEIFFEKSVYQAYRSTKREPCLYPRPQGDASKYNDTTNNWNAVCTSNFGMASLALMEYEEYAEYGAYILSNNLYTLVNVGMEPYAPDGAYEEGTAYWAYATNWYFRLCMTLDNAAGTNYGLMDCWGIDLTSYYACQTESSDFKCFNYNDSNEAPQTTYFFYYVAEATNDPALAAIRSIQIKNGKNVALYDLLAWPTEDLSDVELPLDYVSDGLDLFTARSSWESGALFVGIIGGSNKQSHGNMHAGSFVYHNEGTVWFCDFGSDTYEVPGYWNYATRYRYYTMKPEGHNTIAISSSTQIPFGQVLDSVSPIVDFQTNEHGSYVLYNMTPALDSLINSPVSMWNRGLLLTHDRKTVIIQDELYLSNIHTVYWFAHYHADRVKPTVSDDGRTAYLTDAFGNTLRVSIVSKSTRFKFELMDSYTFIHTSELDGTYPPEYAANSGAPEKDRSNFKKLAIKGEDVLSFTLSVVIEMNVASNSKVPYEWTPMSQWVPSAYEEGDSNAGAAIVNRTKPKRSEISTASAKLGRYFNDGTAFGTKFDDFYRSLTDLKYALDYYGESSLGSSYGMGADALDVYGGEYETYIGKINGKADKSRSIIKSLLGL